MDAIPAATTENVHLWFHKHDWKFKQFHEPTLVFRSSIHIFILDGELSTLVYGNMSDIYLYICVCVDRSIVINNISKCISEAETQNYRNCKWKNTEH